MYLINQHCCNKVLLRVFFLELLVGLKDNDLVYIYFFYKKRRLSKFLICESRHQCYVLTYANLLNF